MASQPEPPEEVSALHRFAAAMHTKCMVSDQFMVAIQQEAACMTARQAEQLQVSMFYFAFRTFSKHNHDMRIQAHKSPKQHSENLKNE